MSSMRFTHFKLTLPSVELFCCIGGLWHQVAYRSSYPLKTQDGQFSWVCSSALETCPQGELPKGASPIKGYLGIKATLFQRQAKSFEPQDIPQNFWAAVYFDPRDLDRWERGTLRGIKGISASPEILYEFLSGPGMAFIRLPGARCVARNKLSRVMYTNPNYLMSKNMAALQRIIGVNSPISTLDWLFTRILEQPWESMADFRHYRDQQERDVAHSIEASPINSEVDFLRHFFKTINGYNATDPEESKRIQIAPQDAASRLHHSLERCAKNYGHENEWILKNNELKLVEGSHIGVHLPRGFEGVAGAMAAYQQILSTFHGDPEAALSSKTLSQAEKSLVSVVSAVLELREYVKGIYTVGFLDGTKFREIAEPLKQRNYEERLDGKRPGYLGERSAGLKASRMATHFQHQAANGDKPDLGENGIATDESGQFWGSAGAGCVFYAQDTGRILLPYRSTQVNEPHCWGVWGGAIDSDEAPEAAARREAREEAGYIGPLDLKKAFVFNKDKFRYTTFLAIVDTEFQPKLNWESEAFQWCEVNQLPTPLHFGLKAALSGLKQAIGEFE